MKIVVSTKTPAAQGTLASKHRYVRATRLALILWVFAGYGARASVVPADRSPDRTPGTAVGVVGGIPARDTISTTLSPSGGDDTAAIQSALNNCKPEQTVLLNPGAFTISNQILLRSNVTLRGSGPTQTTINCLGGAQFYTNGDWPNPLPTVSVSSGATAGSKVLTMSDTTTVSVGNLVTITQLNPDYVRYNPTYYGSGPNDCGHDKTRLMALTFKATAKTSTSVTIEHPLPIDMTNAPMLTVWKFVTTGCGIENLTIDQTKGSSSHPIWFIQTYGCWVKNVEFSHPFQRSIWLQDGVNCEVRQCYMHDETTPKSEGLDLYQNCCWNLIEDNILVRAGYPMIILGDWGGGCSCNVIGYNYCLDERSGVGTAGFAILDNHGPHNMFNLYEGNMAQNIVASDGYYGSSSHGTIFRNFASGQFDRSLYLGEACIIVSKWSPYYSVVGNVFGVSSYGSVYEASGLSYQDGVIYKLGYPNASQQTFPTTDSNPSNPEYFDSNVVSTLIRHGNYDFVKKSITWDPNNADHTIPRSLYYGSTPSWWPVSVAFPPIGPDRNPMVSDIPAKIRLGNLSGISAPSALRVVAP